MTATDVEMPDTTIPAAIDDKWINYVADDLRGRLPESASRALHDDITLAPRRLAALLALKKGVESQLSAQRGRLAQERLKMVREGRDEDYEQFRADQLEWRGRAVRFLSSVESHILAVREQLAAVNIAPSVPDIGVVDAIRAHFEWMQSEDMELSEADRALYHRVGLL